MRVLAALVIFALGVIMGYTKSTELKKRSQLLTELKQLIRELSVRIAYTAPTLDELSEDCGGLFGELLRNERSQACDIRAAWSGAVDRLSEYTFCGGEEAALMRELGSTLGTSDVQGQLSMLDMYAARLSVLSAAAEEALRTKGKMFRSVGALLGAGLAVLVI